LAGLPGIETVIATQKIIIKKLNSVLAIETLSAEVFPTTEAESPLLMLPSPAKQTQCAKPCRSIDGVKSDKRVLSALPPKADNPPSTRSPRRREIHRRRDSKAERRGRFSV
jgi:hypothetical protein